MKEQSRQSAEKMPYLVQKFGGQSVADTARIQNVASLVHAAVQKGYQVAVVVSAMAGVTGQLIQWVKACGGVPDDPESDSVLASGEHVTAGLLALALQGQGLKARSWAGWQLPVRTESVHGKAPIICVETQALKQALARQEIGVITGFQGVTPEGRITTLGRGGSDITAVALAAALKAVRCEIYTDVDGVYTADPHRVPRAQKLDTLSYEDMLHLSTCGAQVLHPSAVLYARAHCIPLTVLSSLKTLTPGTQIGSFYSQQRPVSGITSNANLDLIIVKDKDLATLSQALHTLFSQNHITFDVLTTCYPNDQQIALTVAHEEVDKALFLIKTVQPVCHIEKRQDLASVSVVFQDGYIQIDHLQEKMLTTLGAKKIPVHGICREDFQISALIQKSQANRALKYLHDAYGLGQKCH